MNLHSQKEHKIFQNTLATFHDITALSSDILSFCILALQQHEIKLDVLHPHLLLFHLLLFQLPSLFPLEQNDYCGLEEQLHAIVYSLIG